MPALHIEKILTPTVASRLCFNELFHSLALNHILAFIASFHSQLMTVLKRLEYLTKTGALASD